MTNTVATYSTERLEDIDPLPDGDYRHRPVRHHFGITSFGVTAWLGAAAGDPIINEYDEDSEPAEELFIVANGRAIFDLDGEQIDGPVGTLVYAGPGTPRTAVAAEPSTTVLAVDGEPGRAYDATGWELWAPIREHAVAPVAGAVRVAGNLAPYPRTARHATRRSASPRRRRRSIDH